MVDVLVSLAVIAVLVALLLPSLSSVRETTRRVICSSNVRQHGLGLQMYADDYQGLLPRSRFSPHSLTPASVEDAGKVQEMMLIRTDGTPGDWDGLGRLFVGGYLDAPGVFYCPSHQGDHPFSRYADAWAGNGEIVGNYHYRGHATPLLHQTEGGRALIADGMRTKADYNHRIGSNVLRVDLSVNWFQDSTGALAKLLPDRVDDAGAPNKIGIAWQELDRRVVGP